METGGGRPVQLESDHQVVLVFTLLGRFVLLAADQGEMNMENHQGTNAEPPGKKRPEWPPPAPPRVCVTSSHHCPAQILGWDPLCLEVFKGVLWGDAT